MKIITIDLDIDFIFGMDAKDLIRLKEIVNNSIIEKKRIVSNEKLDFDLLKTYYNQVFSKSMRVVTELTQRNLNKRIKEGYTKADIKKAIDNASNDKFHEDSEFKHVTLEFISSSKIFTRYVSEKEHQTPRNKKLLKQRQEQGHTNH